jgi:pyridoxal biosynthesis lyase PdxS
MSTRREPSEEIHTLIASRLKRAVVREARERGIALRSVLEGALIDRYDPERGARDQQQVIRELKTLRREITHISAGNKVLFEALALLVKNLFSSLTPPTAEGRLAGDAFYTRFIDAVVRAIEANEPLMDQVLALAIVQHDNHPPETEIHPDA